MANKKISDLAAASALSGPELFEVLQGGVNKKVTGAQLLVLVGSSAFVDKETPTGVIDGVNATYTLAFTPIAGSDHVFLNGFLQTETVDYNISGVTITFVTPPSIADTLKVSYRK